MLEPELLLRMKEVRTAGQWTPLLFIVELERTCGLGSFVFGDMVVSFLFEQSEDYNLYPVVTEEGK